MTEDPDVSLKAWCTKMATLFPLTEPVYGRLDRTNVSCASVRCVEFFNQGCLNSMTIVLSCIPFYSFFSLSLNFNISIYPCFVLTVPLSFYLPNTLLSSVLINIITPLFSQISLSSPTPLLSLLPSTQSRYIPLSIWLIIKLYMCFICLPIHPSIYLAYSSNMHVFYLSTHLSLHPYISLSMLS